MNVMVFLECWERGGTEQYVSALYKELRKLEPKLILHLVVLKGTASEDVSEPEAWCDSVTYLDASGVKKRISELINQFTPDICHMHLYTSTLSVAQAVRKINSSKLIATFHSPLSQWKWRHRVKFWLAVRYCDAVIGASEFTANQLRSWDKNVVTASPPVDVSGALVESRKRRQAGDDFLIVGCGRLSREKSWSTLIESLGRLKIGPKVRLELIGDGPLMESLKKLAIEHNVESQVSFLGQMPHNDALKRMAAADVFVLPSRFEGFGMSAVEAMMLGVPTITADFPASAEFIDQGVTGHNFPFDDAQQLTDLIRWHAEHPDDALKIGIAGQAFVNERYQSQRIASLHFELYQSRLKNS